MDSQIPSKGKVIIHNLNEVLTQIKDLEPLCADYLHSLQRCEKSLIQIAVDIACVCTGVALHNYSFFKVMVTYWVSYLVSKGSTKLHQITQNCIGSSFTAAHPMQLKC